MGKEFFRRLICVVTLTAFVFTSVRSSYAQSVLMLPTPGTMMGLSQPFNPSVLKGIKVYRNDPFRFDFILDIGDVTETDGQLKKDSSRLIKYFLAALTVPEKDLWVNLSPYEKDRIVPQAFGQTEMGRDLLAQDYVLKQITASIIYPEGEIGKRFWDKIYSAAFERYGTTDIPVDTFNKVWIVPDKAVVYENGERAYIVKSHLRVMLESDYTALDQAVVKGADSSSSPPTQELAKNVLREVVVPEIEREVNEGKNFAQLRQVYQSLILAVWFKKKIKESMLSKVYVDREKIDGVNIDDPKMAEKIWFQYVETLKKGVYNYIKEEYDPATEESVPRKYFSGGIDWSMITDQVMNIVKDFSQVPQNSLRDRLVRVFFKSKRGDE